MLFRSGAFIIHPNASCESIVGLLTKSDVVNSHVDNTIANNYILENQEMNGFSGAGFKFSKLLSSVPKFVSVANKLKDTYHDAKNVYKELMGDGLAVGGKMATKHQLKREMLKHY